jgi:hypothetical protein
LTNEQKSDSQIAKMPKMNIETLKKQVPKLDFHH